MTWIKSDREDKKRLTNICSGDEGLGTTFDVVAKFLFGGRGVSNFRGALAGGLR